MDQAGAELPIVEGRVKWFDPTKGFGFVLDGAGGPDILLHANVLRNFGQGSVADGARITIRVQVTPRGAQAVEVIDIAAPPAAEDADQGLNTEFTEAELAEMPLQPVRVKWFDKGKGFGFANLFGDSTDIFIHAEVLRRSALAALAPGEAVGVRITEGRRGLMAAQILPWDAAVRRNRSESPDDKGGQ